MHQSIRIEENANINKSNRLFLSIVANEGGKGNQETTTTVQNYIYKLTFVILTNDIKHKLQLEAISECYEVDIYIAC